MNALHEIEYQNNVLPPGPSVRPGPYNGMTEVIQTTVEAQRRGKILQIRRVLPRIRDLLNKKSVSKVFKK